MLDLLLKDVVVVKQQLHFGDVRGQTWYFTDHFVAREDGIPQALLKRCRLRRADRALLENFVKSVFADEEALVPYKRLEGSYDVFVEGKPYCAARVYSNGRNERLVAAPYASCETLYSTDVPVNFSSPPETFLLWDSSTRAASRYACLPLDPSRRGTTVLGPHDDRTPVAHVAHVARRRRVARAAA
jgi:hypothetical protein